MIAWLIARGVPASFARPLAIGAGVLLVAALCALAWRCSVDTAVDNRVQRGRAEASEKARKADQQSATQARADDGRNRAERGELERIRPDENRPLSDSQRAYLRCVRLQQRARAAGDSAPAC